MNKALQVDNLAPLQDFADSLARGLGESAGLLAETVALSTLTAGVINPLTTGIAQEIPYLYSWLFPVARDAITFGAQSALEPGATIGSTGVGAGAGAALGFLGPCGRIARALGAAGIGLAQEYMSNPNAGPMDYARNAALMGTFAAIGAARKMTPDEAAAYSILDWAKGKYSDEAVARSLKMQGIGPLANEFAEDVRQRSQALQQEAAKANLAIDDPRIISRVEGREVRPDEILISPVGSRDWGQIDEQTGTAIDHPSAPIRPQLGTNEGPNKYGLVHIEERHGADIRNTGYSDVDSYVHDIINNFNEIRQGEGQSLILVKQNGKLKTAFIELQPSEEGTFYTVRSSFPVREEYLNKYNVLWPGSATPGTCARHRLPILSVFSRCRGEA